MNSRTIELSPERWSLVERLFQGALLLDPDDRRAYLDVECAQDEELRDYLLALLRIGPAATDDSIEKTILETVNEVFGDQQNETIQGEMIGQYRVDRLLGAGGMGMVYLAHRADQQFDQQVAIKLGRHRLVDPQTELRLRNERQILADLDHQNIAKLFDGGTTNEGVPYLVMEYIDGVRIDAYCDLHRWTIDQRLRLFLSICAAVHYAHQNLIIHRDIKAANILVAADGTPKLLDFGIAKLTDPQGSATDGLTREGAVILTPANAAPEQILGHAVTTATDVYALGLLLYSLLSGLRAYETDAVTPAEFARIVCRQSTIPPSIRLEQAHHAAKRSGNPDAMQIVTTLASDRGTSPDRLQRRLRGDLDTIVLNALRKDPERRYRSVSALADDIDLHLRSMPIIARADSWRYRAFKFMRRHYAAVSVSALIVAMLASFTVLLSIQNRNIVKERDTAREVSQFLEDIFMARDPAQARGASITADELLASGAERIHADLGSRPEIQAALMGTIGRVYFNLGVYESSAEMLEQALQLRLRALGDSHPDVASVQNDLAETLIRLADYAGAEALLTDALATNERRSGPTSQDVARNLFNLAELHLKTSELDKAESFASASIDVYAQYVDGYSIELAEAKNMLARILQVRGDLDQTEALLLESIEIVTRNEGADHPLTAYYLQNLGVLQRSKGDFKAAEETFRRAVDATRRILGEKHHLLAATLVNQGTLLHANGDLENAERVLRDALQLHIETRGSDHPMVGYDKTALGMLLHDRSKLAEAEQMLRGALVIFASAYSEDHQYTASALTELGAVLNTTGRLTEAGQILERAMRIRAKDYPDDHELVAGTRTEYADTLSRLGRFDEAAPILQESLTTLSDRPGRRHDRARAAWLRLRERSALAQQD